jgi:hypothetical protein
MQPSPQLERGSTKLLARLFADKPNADHNDVARALGIDVIEAIEITKLYWKGTPVVDFVYGSLHVPINKLGDLATKLVGSELAFEVFPLGIIAPKAAQVNFSNFLEGTR